MNKDKWLEFRAVQEAGYCNMLDRNCIGQVMDFTKEEHNEYISNYEKYFKMWG